MKIYITGCGGSGTVLLLRLFYAFKDVDIIFDQTKLEKFIKAKSNKKFHVTKRIGKTIFSGGIGMEGAKKQKSKIEANKIRIVNIVRDGRDVLTGRHFKMKPIRWIRSVKQKRKLGDIIDINVKYEQLCTSNPDVIQKKIMKKFGLKKKANFSDYPNFVPGVEKVDVHNPEARYHDLRPISSDSIGKSWDWASACSPKEAKIIRKLLKKEGYS